MFSFLFSKIKKNFNKRGGRMLDTEHKPACGNEYKILWMHTDN